MKKIISIITLVLITIFSFSQTQGQLNDDAQNEFEKADKELNKIYNTILKSYRSDTVFIKNLKRSQKLWVQLRDVEMIVKFPDREHKYYGSVLPMCWSLYKEELTRRRINELSVWLNGVEEGDVCTGSVKIKTQ